MIFNENLFCGRVFNDAINLPLGSFMKKYEAKSKSVKEDDFFKSTTFVLDDSTTLLIRSDSPNKVTSCQCQFKEPSKIEQFIKTVQDCKLFEYESFTGTLCYYPENTNGLSMEQISIYVEKTMFYYFVELILTY